MAYPWKELWLNSGYIKSWLFPKCNSSHCWLLGANYSKKSILRQKTPNLEFIREEKGYTWLSITDILSILGHFKCKSNETVASPLWSNSDMRRERATRVSMKSKMKLLNPIKMPTIREDMRSREKARSGNARVPRSLPPEIIMPVKEPVKVSKANSIRRGHVPRTPSQLHAMEVPTRAASSTRLHPSQHVISTTNPEQDYSCVGSVHNSCENTLPPFTVWKNKNGKSHL